MSVILIVRAMYGADAAADGDAADDQHPAQPVGDVGDAASVVTMAIAMPTMPKRLPCRDEVGLDSPRSARMKHTPATR